MGYFLFPHMNPENSFKHGKEKARLGIKISYLTDLKKLQGEIL